MDGMRGDTGENTYGKKDRKNGTRLLKCSERVQNIFRGRSTPLIKRKLNF
jgi:hypothetical protein